MVTPNRSAYCVGTRGHAEIHGMSLNLVHCLEGDMQGARRGGGGGLSKLACIYLTMYIYNSVCLRRVTCRVRVPNF